MALSYEDALQEWGAQKLEERHYTVDRSRDIKISFEYDDGYADTGTYGSMSESPMASVIITQHPYSVDIPRYMIDFTEIVREIIVAGGGTVTAE